MYNYPKGIKAFYMRLNDDLKTVAAMDVLVPKVTCFFKIFKHWIGCSSFYILLELMSQIFITGLMIYGILIILCYRWES